MLNNDYLEKFQKIQENEKQFRNLMEQSPLPTEILTPEGKISHTNKAWMKLWNLDKKGASETLKKYNEDDIRRTYGMHDVYFDNVMTLCEMFNVPLNIQTENKQTIFATIFMGRGIHNNGIVSDGSNKDRHPEIYNRIKEKG